MSGRSIPDLKRFKSALVLKPSSMGDIVHTLPAVACIKRTFPDIKLRWLCNEEWTPLLVGNPHLEEVIAFPRGSFRGLTAWPRILRWVLDFGRQARERPEVALDFQGLLRSALLGKFRGCQFTAGLSNSREGAGMFHRFVAKVSPGVHAVDCNLALARELGAAVHEDMLEWPLPSGTAPLKSVPENFILLHPFSRGHGKSMDAEALRVFCDLLAPNFVVLAGRVGDPPVIGGSHVMSLLNETTIPELIWLVRRARFIISVDSGPMHIAAAIQPQRTIGIHTWSDPRKVGPYDRRARVWKAGRVASRHEFTDAEAAGEASFTTRDARLLADAVVAALTC